MTLALSIWIHSKDYIKGIMQSSEFGRESGLSMNGVLGHGRIIKQRKTRLLFDQRFGIRY